MRIEPVCSYIATRLKTAVSLFDSGGSRLRLYEPQGFIDPLSGHPSVLGRILETPETDGPVLLFVNSHVCFSFFRIPDGVFVIGPFRFLFSEGAAHARHTMTVEGLSPECISRIPDAYPPTALESVLLLCNCCRETEMTAAECVRLNFDQDVISDEGRMKTVADIFEGRENQTTHNPYDQELRLLRAVEEGDIEAMQKLREEPVPANLGTTALDPVRNGKNMAIYVVTACGRAAIRGGLSAEYVFSLTDSHCRKIEALRNMMHLQSMVQDIQMEFTQMVADLRKRKEGKVSRYHPLLRRCKDYVSLHLHGKLTVEEIAAQFDVHPNYLSSLFHNCEGVSLYQYILLQKIDLAKSLLTYSTHSYIDIANYLGFTSQSHLGKRFKDITGMTLRQYRDRYRK